MKLQKLAALALAFAAVASTAQAQVAKPLTFGVTAGAALPMGDFGDVAKTGFTVGALADLKTEKLPVVLRFNLDYTNFGIKGFSGSVNQIGGTVNALYSFAGESFKPYALGGVGVFNSKMKGADGSTDFGINLGGGVSIPLSGFDTFIEARYRHIFVDGGSAKAIPVTFGIRF